MADTGLAVEAPPKAVAKAPPLFSTPHADASKHIMPDGHMVESFAGAGADSVLEKPGVTHTETSHLQDAQAEMSGGNLQYKEDSPTPVHSAQEKVDLAMVEEILKNAQANKSGNPKSVYDAPISEEMPPPPVFEKTPVTSKPTHKTGSWNWDKKEIMEFVERLRLGAQTFWQKIIAVPKAVLRWITNDGGGKPTPTPPLQFPQAA